MTVLVFILGCAILGWLAGVPLGYAARRLGAASRRGSSAPLAVDLPLQGFQALALAALGWRFGPSSQLLAFGALSLPLALVLFVDLRTRFVDGIVAYPGILAGIVLTPLVRGGPPWEGLASAAAGAAVFGLLYVAGRLLYRGAEPLASGDVTIGALVGSIVGPGHLFPAIVLGVFLSGVLALGYAARRRSLRAYLPYGPGLCLGALLALLR